MKGRYSIKQKYNNGTSISFLGKVVNYSFWLKYRESVEDIYSMIEQAVKKR